MIVKNTQKINYTKLMHEDFGSEAGGGVWEMDLDSAKLTAASTSYSTAAASYSTALEAIISDLDALSGCWEGDAVAEWNTKTASLKTKLQIVGKTLTQNSSNLSQIAAEVETVETNMKTKIKTI